MQKYRLLETQQFGLTPKLLLALERVARLTITARREKMEFSRLSLVAEVARYLNRSALDIEELLDSTKEGTDKIVDAVNQFNELLYDVVIPCLFSEMYDLTPREQTEEHEVELIKIPPSGYYEVTAAKDKILRMTDAKQQERLKSFHLDAYCFDSNPERQLFWDLLRSRR